MFVFDKILNDKILNDKNFNDDMHNVSKSNYENYEQCKKTNLIEVDEDFINEINSVG